MLTGATGGNEMQRRYNPCAMKADIGDAIAKQPTFCTEQYFHTILSCDRGCLMMLLLRRFELFAQAISNAALNMPMCESADGQCEKADEARFVIPRKITPCLSNAESSEVPTYPRAQAQYCAKEVRYASILWSRKDSFASLAECITDMILKIIIKPQKINPFYFIFVRR